MSLPKDGLRRAALTLAVVSAAIWYSVLVEGKDTSGPAPASATSGTSGAIANNATLPGNQ